MAAMTWEGGERRASVALTGLIGTAAAATRSWSWLRLVLTAVWLAYLAQPLSSLPHLHHGALWMAAAAAVTAAFCVVFVVVVARWDLHPARVRWGLAALFVLAALFSLMFPSSKSGGSVVWIYVSSATGWVVPDRRAAARAVVGVAACYLLFSWLGHDGTADMLVTLIPVVLVGMMMSGIRVQIKLMRELSKAREAVAMLAASEERLRLARDMHDLTGQSLSMITLKSELAERLLRRLPEGPDRDRVAEEILQVAAVSRQTLHDIREAISGYRRPTLAVEIITARTALESAGIAPHDDPALTLLSGMFGPDAEAALAWCLREAVTNVIRHSGARNCHISLTRHSGGTLSLEVRDDGPGRPAAAGEAADDCDSQPVIAGSLPHSSGTGLHGMAERLTAVGGHLELRWGTPGFCLVATVPATVPAAAVPAAAASAYKDAYKDAYKGAPEHASAAVTVTR
jgi:two-component system sensor histidine kinase DesK